MLTVNGENCKRSVYQRWAGGSRRPGPLTTSWLVRTASPRYSRLTIGATA